MSGKTFFHRCRPLPSDSYSTSHVLYDLFIQAVQRDGSVVELGADQEELRRLMETELLAVQIACLAGLSRIIDWTVLSSRRGAILLSPPVQVRTDPLVNNG